MVGPRDLGGWSRARRGVASPGALGPPITYDVKSDETIRSIHVAGILRFDPERDTRLDVGLIKIQAGDDPGEIRLRLRVGPKRSSFPGRRVRLSKLVRPIARSARTTPLGFV